MAIEFNRNSRYANVEKFLSFWSRQKTSIFSNNQMALRNISGNDNWINVESLAIQIVRREKLE
jgi:hypothetical protein